MGPGTDADYTGTLCTVTFFAGSAPGATSTFCSIPLISDSCLEEDETFSLTATILNSNGQSAQFIPGGDSASATIIDDDGMLAVAQGNMHFPILTHILFLCSYLARKMFLRNASDIYAGMCRLGEY